MPYLPVEDDSFGLSSTGQMRHDIFSQAYQTGDFSASLCSTDGHGA